MTQCRPTTMMNPLCRPVLQRLRSCGRFLFIKLARNEAEPSAKVKHAEIPRSRRQCIARQRCLHCHCLPVRLWVVGCSFLIRPGGRRAAQSRRARLVVGRLPASDGSEANFSKLDLGAALTGELRLDPPLKSLFIHNSNPVSQQQNANKLIQGLKREDTRRRTCTFTSRRSTPARRPAGPCSACCRSSLSSSAASFRSVSAIFGGTLLKLSPVVCVTCNHASIIGYRNARRIRLSNMR